MDGTATSGWSRFRLRTLLVVLSVLCVGIAVFQNSRGQRQRRAVLAIRGLGGNVNFDYQRNPRGRAGQPTYVPIDLPLPRWVDLLVGEEAFGNVSSVSLGNPDRKHALPARSLRHLRSLPELEELSLINVSVRSDLAELKSARGLKSVSLHATDVGDADLVHLASLRDLIQLNLNNTAIGDDGLRHLSGLKALKYLRLKNTNVTSSGVDQLRRALPGCDISQ